MVVSYTPVTVDPYGVSTIKADCLSASVKRTSESARPQNWQDAAETFAGKSWTFTVDARGKIVDTSKFVEVLRQAGQRAFRADRSKGLIKEPGYALRCYRDAVVPVGFDIEQTQTRTKSQPSATNGNRAARACYDVSVRCQGRELHAGGNTGP